MTTLHLLLLSGFRTVRASWRSFVAAGLMAAVTTMLFVAFNSARADLERSRDHVYERLRFLDFYLPLAPCPRRVIDLVRRVPGVEAAEGRCHASVRIPVPAGVARDRERLASGRIIGIPVDRHPTVNDVHVEKGRYLLAHRGEALMERRFAEAHGYRVGSRVSVMHDRGRIHLVVVGLVSSPELIWISPSQHDPRPVARRVGVLFAAEQDACAAAGWNGINEIHARVLPGHDASVVMAEARKRVQPYATEPAVPREAQRSHAMLEHDRRALAGVALVFPLVFLVVGAAATAGAFKQLLSRQRREMGILLALGLSARQVATPYRAIALLVCGGGGLLGGLAGLALGHLCTRFYASTLGLPFVATGLDLPSLLGGIAWVAGVSVGASEWVIRRVEHLEPARLWGLETAAALRLPRLEGRWSLLARAPLMLRLPLRNLFRNRARTLWATVGLVLATMQILMALAVFDSLEASQAFFFEKVYRYDLHVSLDRPVSPVLLPPVGRMPGVLRVEAGLYQPVLISAQGRTVDTGVLGIPRNPRLLRLHDSQGRSIEVGDDGPLFLSSVLQRRLALEPGRRAEVRIDVPRPERPVLSVSVGPTLFEPVAINPRLPLHRLQALAAATWHAPPDGVNVLMVKVEPDALDSIRSRLDHCPSVETVVDLAQAREDVRHLLDLAYAFLALMVIFSGLLAFALLSGTTTMNIMERTRELVLMSALGVEDAHVTRLLLAETVIVWLVALVPGILAGWITGGWLLNRYQSDVIQASLSLSPRSIVGTTVASLAISVLATLHSVRFTRHTKVATGLGEEEG